MARLPWRRRGDADTTKAAPAGATMVPLGEVIAAVTQQATTPTTVGDAEPLQRPEEWFRVPFNPGQPLYPQPINPTRQDTHRAEPRVWEYPVSWNLRYSSNKLIPWKTLRDAADAPIVRQCIKTRQKALTGLDWDVTISQDAINDLKKQGASTAEATDALRQKLAPEIDRLAAFWRRPDAQQGLNFASWLWQLMEEQLVLDAVAIYPRYTYGRDLLGLRTIDGSTIKPLLDADGARPEPPFPAYQQILYGFPRGEYVAEVDTDGIVEPGMTADQLIYQRREVRVWTPYGFSPVEQALVDVDLYLKRHGWMRSEYDDGVTPEMVLKNLGTNQWTPQQTLEYERDYNDQQAGQTAQRMRARVLPPGLEPAQLANIPERYKAEYDLHLIKLVASHFDVPITELGFSEAKGLGSSGWSEGQESVNYRGGTLPDAKWWGSLLTEIQRIHLGAPAELEFKFLGLDEEDEQIADQVSEARVKSGRLTVNEDRDRLGLPRFDIPEADIPLVMTGRSVIPLEGAIAAAEAAAKPPAPGGGPGGPGGAPEQNPGDEGDQGDQGDEGEQQAKAELATFRKWARKRTAPGRPFEFTADRDVLLTLAPDLADDGRVAFKDGGGGDPKAGPDWPAWERDEALAAIYARKLRKALVDAVGTDRLAQAWLAVRVGADTGEADAIAWLADRGLQRAIEDALRSVLGDAWTEAWAAGEASARAVLAHLVVDWGGWAPGNPAAARELIGGAQALEDLLAHYGIDRIKSIARTRLGELAARLGEALRDGWSSDRLARELRGVLNDPRMAGTVAQTEISRASSEASLNTYRQQGVAAVEWLISPSNVCIVCEQNADASPVRLGQPFPSGDEIPPAHPNCRCAPMPVLTFDPLV